MLKEFTAAATPEKETLELPERCELAVRIKCGIKYYFVLNYSAENVLVNCKHSLWDLNDKTVVVGKVGLNPYGTIMLREIERKR